MRRSLLLIPLALLLGSCNVLFAPTPEVWTEPSGLGSYETRPTFGWAPKGVVQPTAVRVRLEGPGIDIAEELPASAESYRPTSFLDTGRYTFSVETRAASGTWSEPAVLEHEVVNPGRYEPNDPLFAEPAHYDPYDGDAVQWNLDSVHIPRLWSLLRSDSIGSGGREPVVVAVVDTGYTEHPDIVASMDVDAGYDFISDYIDSADGTKDYFYSCDGDGIDPDPRDEGDAYGGSDNSWHGTGVASIIAATADNAMGLAGIADVDGTGDSYVTHVPIRVLGVMGGTTYDIGQGIAYAAGLPGYLDEFSGALPQERAKIINLSLGAGLPGQPLYTDPAVEPILEAAAGAGSVLVAAAGNERIRGAEEVTFPANSPYVISVGAATVDRRPSDYSNPGTFTGSVPSLDVVAPGGGPPYVLPPDVSGTLSWYEYVVTASPDPEASHPLTSEDFDYFGTAGTSIAAPHVSGLLALLATVGAERLDLDTARYVLKHSAFDLGPVGWDAESGFGLIDAVDAYAVFRSVLDGTVDVPETTPSPIRTRLRMGEAGVPPDGPIDAGSLIVSFRSREDALIAQAAGIPGVRSVKPASGVRRLVLLREGSDPQMRRDELLERADVELVFYNYRYRPL